jgi:hypothetical protein
LQRKEQKHETIKNHFLAGQNQIFQNVHLVHPKKIGALCCELTWN